MGLPGVVGCATLVCVCAWAGEGAGRLNPFLLPALLLPEIELPGCCWGTWDAPDTTTATPPLLLLTGTMAEDPLWPENDCIPTVGDWALEVLCIGWLPAAGVPGEGAVLVVGVFVPPAPVVPPDAGGPDGSLIIGFNLIRAQIGLPFKIQYIN